VKAGARLAPVGDPGPNGLYIGQTIRLPHVPTFLTVMCSCTLRCDSPEHVRDDNMLVVEPYKFCCYVSPMNSYWVHSKEWMKVFPIK
jgi:hypothetical protein